MEERARFYMIFGFRMNPINPNDYGVNCEADNPLLFNSCETAMKTLFQIHKFIISNNKTTWADTPEQEAECLGVGEIVIL